MTDYYSPTVIPEVIPNMDMTKLEYLLLSRMFESDSDGEYTYFHSWQGPSDMIWVQRSELTEALQASRGFDSDILPCVEEQIENLPADETEMELDLSGVSWEVILRDIVRRSPTLRYISVMTAFTCSKMRSDGFGGMAVFVTAKEIKWCSTTEFLSDCLAEIVSGDDEG